MEQTPALILLILPYFEISCLTEYHGRGNSQAASPSQTMARPLSRSFLTQGCSCTKEKMSFPE